MIEVRNQFNTTLIKLDGDFLDEDSSLKVGELVSFYLSPNSFGVIIGIIDFKTCRVLWNNFHNPFKHTIRSTISGLIHIQPMPSGASLYYV